MCYKRHTSHLSYSNTTFLSPEPSACGEFYLKMSFGACLSSVQEHGPSTPAESWGASIKPGSPCSLQALHGTAAHVQGRSWSAALLIWKIDGNLESLNLRAESRTVRTSLRSSQNLLQDLRLTMNLSVFAGGAVLKTSLALLGTVIHPWMFKYCTQEENASQHV